MNPDLPVSLAGRLHGLTGLDRLKALQAIRSEVIGQSASMDTETLIWASSFVAWIDNQVRFAA